MITVGDPTDVRQKRRAYLLLSSLPMLSFFDEFDEEVKLGNVPLHF